MQYQVLILLGYVFLTTSCSRNSRENSSRSTPTNIEEIRQESGDVAGRVSTRSSNSSSNSNGTGQGGASSTSSGASSTQGNNETSNTNRDNTGNNSTTSTDSCQDDPTAMDCVSSETEQQAANIVDVISLPAVISEMNSKALTSITPSNTRVESTVYRWPDFIEAYKTVAIEGINGKVFSPGESIEAGLINIAIFLGQSMHETIQYNACDENNWSIGIGGPDYPVTAACGQAGQDYSQYNCKEENKHMQCPVDPQMTQQASTMAGWYGAPPPLFCGPKSLTGSAMPRWNFNALCTQGGAVAADLPSWINDNIKTLNQSSCLAYPGQQAGSFTLEGCGPEGCLNSDKIDTAGGQLRTHQTNKEGLQ